jgi:hypothetical protein
MDMGMGPSAALKAGPTVRAAVESFKKDRRSMFIWPPLVV